MLKGQVDDGREAGAALARIPDDIKRSAQAKDAAIGAEIVQRARARVPVDSGALLNGITERQDGEATIVEASAVRGDFDYARSIDLGHHITPGFFSERGAGGEVAAEPFFLETAYDVLSGREPALDACIDEASEREGFR